MFQYPQRSVEANCLHSSALPAMRLELHPNFEYLGNLKSSIYDVAAIDNYYFVEKDSEGIIQRIVYLQFESYLPEINASYDYPNMTDIQLGNLDFVYDGGVRTFHQHKIDDLRQDSDVAQTVKFLRENGVQFREGQLYGSLRFVHLIGEAKRDEVLILYMERLQDADVPESIIAKSRESEEWANYCQGFLARALDCFKVCAD